MILKAVEIGALSIQLLQLLFDLDNNILGESFLEDQRLVQDLRLVLFEVFKIEPE